MQRKTLFSLVPLLISALILTACPGGDSAEPSAPSEAPAQESAPEPAADPTATPESESGDAESTGGAEVAEEAAAQGPRTFIIVSEESSASYIVQEEFFAGALAKYGINVGNYEIVGTTPGVSGEMTLDLANATIGDNRFVVDLTGLQTDQNRRDNWVQNEDPNFSSFPKAVFVATAIENAPADYAEGTEASFQLVGDLTVRDVTTPVTFNVTATLNGDTITGSGVADVSFSQFGMEAPNFANTLTVAEDFQIRVDFTARAGS